jgi:hypothetical protein
MSDFLKAAMKIGSGGIIELELDPGRGQQGVYIIDQISALCQPEFVRNKLRFGLLYFQNIDQIAALHIISYQSHYHFSRWLQ